MEVPWKDEIKPAYFENALMDVNENSVFGIMKDKHMLLPTQSFAVNLKTPRLSAIQSPTRRTSPLLKMYSRSDDPDFGAISEPVFITGKGNVVAMTGKTRGNRRSLLPACGFCRE